MTQETMPRSEGAQKAPASTTEQLQNLANTPDSPEERMHT